MMNCPRCGSTSLDERERNGVTVDVCPSCRGVWLDRGELEKLLGHAKRELEEERAYYVSDERDREPPSSSRRHEPQHRSAGHDQRAQHGRHYKKRSWLDNLGEIFD
jgi:Zn-finger nucleic acid-binding protein